VSHLPATAGQAGCRHEFRQEARQGALLAEVKAGGRKPSDSERAEAHRSHAQTFAPWPQTQSRQGEPRKQETSGQYGADRPGRVISGPAFSSSQSIHQQQLQQKLMPVWHARLGEDGHPLTAPAETQAEQDQHGERWDKRAPDTATRNRQSRRRTDGDEPAQDLTG
jgi:hypothetical protein